MLKGKEKHFEEFTVIFFIKTEKSPIKLLEIVLCVKEYFFINFSNSVSTFQTASHLTPLYSAACFPCYLKGVMKLLSFRLTECPNLTLQQPQHTANTSSYC